MKNTLICYLLFVLSAVTMAQNEDYQIRVYQNNQEIMHNKGVIRLSKAPFQLVYVFSVPSNWVIIAGSQSKMKNASNTQSSLLGMLLNAESGGADSYFNTARSIRAWNGEIETAIYYEDDTHHTFDSVYKAGKTIYGVRTLEFLSTQDDELIVEEWPDYELILASASVSYSSGKKSVSQPIALKLQLIDVPNTSIIDVKGKSFIEEGEAHFQEGCEGCGNLGSFDFLRNGKEVEFLFSGSDIFEFGNYTQEGNQVIIARGVKTFTVRPDGNQLTDNEYGTKYNLVQRKEEK